MPYFLHCTDNPEKQSVRTDYMEMHLAYIESILDKIAVAGLWQSVHCRYFMVAAGTWIGGKTW